MTLLYAELDAREAGHIIEILERQKIPYQIGSGGTQVLVPSDQVARLRITLAREGLPSGGSIGYELLDRSDGITQSQFQQKMAETRALEGELARSIRTIGGVKNARVHLVLPRREPFSRERQDAQASVMITTIATQRLDRETVQAIVNLVAGAVPGLRSRNISVVDNRGSLLAKPGESTGLMSTATGTEEIRRATEMRLSRAVEDMLERGLGPGRVRVEVATQMDFDRVQETQEKFDPDGQVIRSTQSISDSSKTTDAASNVTVQNNLPNADAGREQAGNQETRQEETVNFEIGKTVRTIVREYPQIRRLSVAVLVDGVEERDTEGKVTWRPKSNDELERIGRLVRSAVGFDESRGDRIEVVSLRFVGDLEAMTQETRGLLGFGLDALDVSRLTQTIVVGLVAILALFMVFRPMVMRVTTLGPVTLPASVPTAIPAGAMAIGPDGTITAQSLGLANDVSRLLEGPLPNRNHIEPGNPKFLNPDGLPDHDESMINLANVDGQLRASSLRRLADLVEKHPEESLTIVRAWMQESTN